MPKRAPKILTLFGTRPELIKLYPVLRELDRSGICQSIVVSTSQHREMIDDLVDLFSISIDHDLDILQPNQTLAQISTRALSGLDPLLERHAPDLLLVQGDTSTAFIGALAAFYRRVGVGHVEAGLRSRDRSRPFPEEVNRRLISVVADLHFAPTEIASRALLDEGVEPGRVFVTGNTVIDSLLEMAGATGRALASHVPEGALDGRVILVTAHRRESFGRPLEELCRALRTIVDTHPDSRILYPVHLNPNVRATVFRILAGHPRIHLIDPLRYDRFVEAMAVAHLIITDSGGIQEEAPSLGKPVLVVREVSERTEAVAAGGSLIVGLERDTIVEHATTLLRDQAVYRRMSARRHVFGDGKAGLRIVEAILHHFGRGPRPTPFRPD